jgi:predicted transcriptional regulator
MGNTLQGFNKTDEEVIRLLVDLGLSRKTAKTLTFLSHVEESISRTIEEMTKLRQPEVSTALKELRGRGWIEKHPIRKEGKGRPIHSYRMVVPFDRAIKSIVRAKKGEITELQNNIKRLKELTGS